MVTYGTSVIPSDQITVIGGGTVSVSVAFENSIGLVGGMDTDSGTATAGEVTTVRSPSDAQTKFGEGSELHNAVELAYLNGASTVYALPVTETETTESFAASSGGVLDTPDGPIMDPRVQPEHDVTATDTTSSTDIAVEYVDESPPPTPTEADTININPTTREWEADESSDYDITYTHGDYSTEALDPIIDRSPRIVTVLTESVSVTNDLVTRLNARATEFDFMHGVTGASPTISDVPNYTNSVDERRISRVYPSRGYRDAAGTEEARTTAAVGGYLASLALGLSSTNDEIAGFQSVRGELSGPTEAGTLIDERILPLLDYPPLTIVQDATTSSENGFGRVYAMQVVDEAAEVSHTISRQYVGEQNTDSGRQNLRRSHENAYIGMRDGTPKMLDNYTVTVDEDPADEDAVILDIGLSVVDIMDTIDVTITVGDIVRNGGAN